MLQPDRLQPGIAPLKVKKMLNVQFKTAWKYPETGGKSQKKAEKTGSLRKFPERVRKARKFLEFGTKRPWGKPPRASSGGNSVGGFLNRNERSVRWIVATIERTVSNPATRHCSWGTASLTPTIGMGDCPNNYHASLFNVPCFCHIIL